MRDVGVVDERLHGERELAGSGLELLVLRSLRVGVGGAPVERGHDDSQFSGVTRGRGIGTRVAPITWYYRGTASIKLYGALVTGLSWGGLYSEPRTTYPMLPTRGHNR